MPAMSEELKKKLPNAVAAAKLADLAFAELKKANRSPGVAVEGFWPQVAADDSLIVALMRAELPQLRVAAMAYLYERLRDMDRKVQRGASLTDHERQVAPDRPSKDEAQASPVTLESQDVNDRLESGNGSGPSLSHDGSQPRSDRPALRQKAPAAKSKIGKSVVLAYASNSIFARKIGSGLMDVGMCTKQDVIHIKRRGMIDSTVADGLLEFQWPDDHKTKLHEIADEQQLEAVFNRAYLVLDNLGLTNVNR